MRNRGGFQRAGDSVELNPEYVQLQRANVLKKHQDTVRVLQSEVDQLKAKKANLEAEFQTAFQDRLKKLEAREAGDKLGERRRATQRHELEKLQANFEAAQAIAAETHRQNLETLAGETRKAQAILDLAKEKEAIAAANVKSVSESLKVIKAQQEDIATREAALKDAQDKLAKDRAALSKESDGLIQTRQEASDAEQILRISRAENKSTLEKLEAVRAKNLAAAAKLKEEADQNRIDRENNTQTYLSNLETAKALKEQKKALDERDTKLKARETAGLTLITEG